MRLLRTFVFFAILTLATGHYGFATEGDNPAICTAHTVHHIVSLGLDGLFTDYGYSRAKVECKYLNVFLAYVIPEH